MVRDWFERSNTREEQWTVSHFLPAHNFCAIYIYFCGCRVVRFWWSWAQLGQTLGSLGATVSPRIKINSTSVQVLSLVRFPFFGSRQNFSQGTKDPCVMRFDQIIWQNINLSGRVSNKQTDDSKDINAATYHHWHWTGGQTRAICQRLVLSDPEIWFESSHNALAQLGVNFGLN